MKKLLLSSLLIAAVAMACGTSPEEKKAAQEENEAMVNEKVNEIMESLDESAAEEMESDTVTSDSTHSDLHE